MVNDNKGMRPDRPFFAYLPFGATHAPHQAPQEYLD
jgi:arylsulfatase A-like enzyme